MRLPRGSAPAWRDDFLSLVTAGAVRLPVSADLQAGYGSGPDEVGASIQRAILVGVVAANIGDSRGDPEQSLFSIQHASARVEAARKAADTAGIPFVLTARTDAYLLGVSDPFREAVSRCKAYREAGADCLFVPPALLNRKLLPHWFEKSTAR